MIFNLLGSEAPTLWTEGFYQSVKKQNSKILQEIDEKLKIAKSTLQWDQPEWTGSPPCQKNTFKTKDRMEISPISLSVSP